MLRRAIHLEPKLADAHRWLGIALLNVGRHDDALDAMHEAARLQPADANVYSALGRAYWIGRGDVDGGITSLEKATEINPDLGYAHLQLGQLYALRGDYDQAEEACRRAIEMQERVVSGREGLQIVGAYTRLGHLHYLRGRYDEALTMFQQQVEALTGSDHVLKERSLIDLDYKIGATYLKMGRADEAEQHFATALKAYEGRVARDADDPFTKYYMAALSALRGDRDRALRYLREVLVELPAITRTRARVDPDFDPLRDDAEFAALLSAETTPRAAPAPADGVVS